MKRLLLAALLTVSALLATGGSAKAQAHPHFPPFGCGGFCIGFLSKAHFHGPLFNYGPYTGYYPFEPYGPWTSDLRYNPPELSCGQCGRSGCGGHGLGWGHYAVSTLKNVFHRVNPLSHRCGGGLHLGQCGLLGHSKSACTSGCSTAAPCGSAGCAVAATSVQTQPVVTNLPVAVPGVPLAQTK